MYVHMSFLEMQSGDHTLGILYCSLPAVHWGPGRCKQRMQAYAKSNTSDLLRHRTLAPQATKPSMVLALVAERV